MRHKPPRRILKAERIKTVAREEAEGPMERPISEPPERDRGGDGDLMALSLLALARMKGFPRP